MLLCPEAIQARKRIFKLAQQQLRTNAERASRNLKHEYLLRGLIKCGKCGTTMYGITCHNRMYYKCGNGHLRFPLYADCPVRTVRGEPIEAAVWEKLTEAIRCPTLIMKQFDALEARARKRQSSSSADLEAIEEELESA